MFERPQLLQPLRNFQRRARQIRKRFQKVDPINVQTEVEKTGPSRRNFRTRKIKCDAIAVRDDFHPVRIVCLRVIQFRHERDDLGIAPARSGDRLVDIAGLDHRFVQVESRSKVEALVELLEHDGELTLVFVRTKRGADRLVHKLKQKGVVAEALHGDMPQRARQRALERFESGKARVLVATDVAARGLDLERISHVVNYDPPQDDKGYVHRVGRTARAGRTGIGITLVTADQQGDVGRMAARLDLHEAFEEEGMKVAPPQVVFSASAKGRRSGLRARRRRVL